MIIIKSNKKIKSINQFNYNQIINSINFRLIHCPNCQLSDWSTHAYYSRHVDFFNRRHLVRILRVICNGCGQTHAVLVEDMIPYSITSYSLIIDIVFKRDSSHDSLDFFIIHKYQNAIFDYERTCLMNSRFQNRLLHFSTQLLSGFFLFHVKVES